LATRRPERGERSLPKGNQVLEITKENLQLFS